MLAEKLKELRKKKGLTQEQLAEELNVSRQAVAKWESGAGTPDVQNLKNISIYFQVTTDYLLDNMVQKETSLKNKFTIIEFFLLFFGISLGIVAKNFEFGFVCAVLLPAIAICVEFIILEHKYKKEGDVSAEKELISSQLPKNFYGRPLNVRPEGKKERMKWYTIEAVLFASVMTIFETVGTIFGTDEILKLELFTNPTLDSVISMVISFIILFVISWCLDCLIYEHTVKKYNRLQKE